MTMDKLANSEQLPEEPNFEDDLCPRCGCCETYWEDCWSCGGEGGRELFEEDPLWYDRDDWAECDICEGKGGFLICIGHCDKNGKHERN